jgi:hypothetical protein
MANELSLKLRLYQDGILRVLIDEPGAHTDRFSISEHGVGVEEHQLHLIRPLKEFAKIHADKVEI